MMKDWNPLIDPPPTEIPLPRAPLVRVIAQVKFPMVAAIEKAEVVAPFQSLLRDAYPLMRQENSVEITLPPVASVQPTSKTLWRFSDTSNAWKVSLTSDFLALETTAYKSRSDFLARFELLLGHLESTFKPGLVDRLGLRYIDRLADAEGLPELLRREILGISGSSLAKAAQLAITDAVFSVDGAQLRARFGILPPNLTIDPTALEPLQQPTWILDIDMFTTESFPFTPSAVAEKSRSFAERIYALFRWSVTDEFLRKFGGVA